MDKKGFTLMELLATIVIMAIVLALAIPSINSLQNTNKKTSYEMYAKSMVQAARLYMNKEGEDITSLGTEEWTGCVEVSYTDLVQSDFLKPYEKTRKTNDDDSKVLCDGKVRYTRNTKNSKKGVYTYQLSCTQNGKVVFSHNEITGGSCSQHQFCTREKETVLALPVNSKEITTYDDFCADKTAMYAFSHTAGTNQEDFTQEELVDYRYIGENPNNYLRFNDELWRIVGIFTIDDGFGNKAKRIKIVRNDSLGTYAWDNTTVEHENGKNRWRDARLMRVLNEGYETEENIGSLYYNRLGGSCLLAPLSDMAMACDFTTTGLTPISRSQIDNAMWYLGSHNNYNSNSENYYTLERSSSVYTSESFPRDAIWTGKVGLLYPSDYGYTYALGVNATCYNDLTLCTENKEASWMYSSDENTWFMSAFLDNSYQVLTVSLSGNLTGTLAGKAASVKPAVYLKASTKIKSGTGTDSDPYVIE